MLKHLHQSNVRHNYYIITKASQTEFQTFYYVLASLANCSIFRTIFFLFRLYHSIHLPIYILSKIQQWSWRLLQLIETILSLFLVYQSEFPSNLLVGLFHNDLFNLECHPYKLYVSNKMKVYENWIKLILPPIKHLSAHKIVRNSLYQP